MARIKGESVTLYKKTKIGEDQFNNPLYTEEPIVIDDVLIAPISATEILETYTLTGKRVSYQLAIPKGDENEWTSGLKVRFFNTDWRIVATATQGIERLIPLDWNKKVTVESYE